MDILHMIDMVGRGVQKMVSTLSCPTAKNLNPPSSPLIKLKYSPPPKKLKVVLNLGFG